VRESFALIQVPGVPGVQGYASNQAIGRTNRSGNLLVPNMLPYYGNSLRVEDLDIPLNYTIQNNERIIAPPFRGGAVVQFPVQRIQSITGTISIIDASGKIVIPVYGTLTVTLDNNQLESPICDKGEFYLENISSGRYPAMVEYEKGICKFDLNVPAFEKKYS
jgi:outer membrane usher protein